MLFSNLQRRDCFEYHLFSKGAECQLGYIITINKNLTYNGSPLTEPDLCTKLGNFDGEAEI